MLKIIQRTIRGCGYLPTCGEHPGTTFLFVFILMGALAGGTNGGWKGSFFGAGMMTAFVAPLYLMGSYDRAVEEERYGEKN